MNPQPKDPRAELASVLALLDKATPGDFTALYGVNLMAGDGFNATNLSSNVAGTLERNTANAAALIAAANFLRKHGAALTSHGGGGEAVAWRTVPTNGRRNPQTRWIEMPVSNWAHDDAAAGACTIEYAYTTPPPASQSAPSEGGAE